VLFNSLVFIFGFLPAVLALFVLVARRNGMGAVVLLAAASLVFYGWGDLGFLPLLLTSIAGNFCAGLAIARCRAGHRQDRANRVLAVAVVLDLAALAVFKYADFFIASVAEATGAGLAPLGIALPLGISFFTFTQIAFLVDAARGEAEEVDIFRYLLFVTYFPHLIAGPILHHREMMPQFARFGPSLRFNRKAAAMGLTCFAIGLAKKLGIADWVAPTADLTFAAAQAGTALSMAEAWVGALAYTFQIYFDFSGYCDMAIGLSLLFGVRLPVNFNSPYKAASIIDFWRRWHITLSRFLRDYLYIPLGGSRHGPWRRHVNLMATMLLGGLWHGAGWTFVWWGGLHGAFLIGNHAWRGTGLRLPPWLARPLTFACVVVAWVFFRANDVAEAVAMLRAMAGLDGYGLAAKLAFPNEMLVGRLPPVLAGAALFALVWLAPNTQEWLGRFRATLEPAAPQTSRLRWRPSTWWGAVAGVAFAVAVTLVGGDSPFLYFRF
jgi:D-alanyl-lipoteichoic acid acyltransferase DltB (MBOAT superfamily)